MSEQIPYTITVSSIPAIGQCGVDHHKTDNSAEEDISAELIPEAEPLEINAEFQFSAIPQIYSKPTTLDFSVAFVQGLYHYDISGSLVTVSPNSYNETNPWSVEHPDTGSFINTDIFTKTDYKRLFDEWTKEAGIKIIKTPDEIMPSISE